MKFPTDRPVKVVMLGAGGTGGYVAPYDHHGSGSLCNDDPAAGRILR